MGADTIMSDLVERLRGHAKKIYANAPIKRDCLQAADEIERLTGERDRQYDQNVEQIKRIAELEAEARKREWLLQRNYVKRAELEATIERLRGALLQVKYASHTHMAVGIAEEALKESDDDSANVD